MFVQIGLFIALASILLVAYTYAKEFAANPNTGILLAVISVSLLYSALLVWKKFNKSLGSERMPDFMKVAAYQF